MCLRGRTQTSHFVSKEKSAYTIITTTRNLYISGVENNNSKNKEASKQYWAVTEILKKEEEENLAYNNKCALN